MKLGDRSFQPFWGVFAQEIFPSIQQDYETLLKSMPSRVETHLGEKEEKLKRRMSKKGEDEEKEKEKKKETENEQKVDPVQAKLLKLLRNELATGNVGRAAGPSTGPSNVVSSSAVGARRRRVALAARACASRLC